jgi:two-component system response regulator FixJ
MPGMSGIDLLRKLRESNMTLPVIVITGHGDVPLAVEAMRIGAMDFLEKPYDDEALLSSVRNALGQGEKISAERQEKAQLLERSTTLSSREREVLEGLVAGQPNKIIAFNLGISPRTVEIYRANVMTKMKAGSLSELVRMALIAGLMPTNK